MRPCSSVRRRRPAGRARRGAPRPGLRRGGRPRPLRARARAGRARAEPARRRSSTGDARLAWRGDAVGARRLGGDGSSRSRRRASSSSTSRRPGLTPGRSRICEIGAVRIERLEVADDVPDARRPGRRASGRRDRADRASPTRELRGAPAPARPSAASSPSRATPCSWPTTRASTSRFLDREVERLTGLRSPARSSTRSGSRAACSPAGGRAARPRRALAVLRDGDAAVPSRAARTREATAEILLRLIGLAQERGARTRRGPRRARHAAGAARARQAPARRARRRSGRASTSSATGATASSTSARPATCARGCVRTSAPGASGPRWRRRWPPWSGSSGACSGRSSRRRWRSCASSVSCARRRMRARKPAGALPAPARPGWVVVARSRAALGPLTSRARAPARGPRAGRVRQRPVGRACPPARASCATTSDALRYEDAARLRDRIAALEQIAARVAAARPAARARGLAPRPGGGGGLPPGVPRQRRPGGRGADAAARRRRAARARRRPRRGAARCREATRPTPTSCS